MQGTCPQYGNFSWASPVAAYRGSKVTSSAHYLAGLVSSPEVGDGTLWQRNECSLLGHAYAFQRVECLIVWQAVLIYCCNRMFAQRHCKAHRISLLLTVRLVQDLHCVIYDHYGGPMQRQTEAGFRPLCVVDFSCVLHFVVFPLSFEKSMRSVGGSTIIITGFQTRSQYNQCSCYFLAQCPYYLIANIVSV